MELKIIYFDFPFWRAEVARIPLFLADIKFEDVLKELEDRKKQSGIEEKNNR